ncbi:MAG: hypothetical protein ISR96_11420 [Nitrospira sp.]|nr:hypothetical protein [bacterium]MBL7050114.1 hypothetical protein [Nitrospira sp.]
MNKIKLLLIAAMVTLITSGIVLASGNLYWDLPKQPSVEEYGNILINRTSSASKIKAVTFSHWLHRTRHTCRVCHTELKFELALNKTVITEKDNMEGRFCGACHNDNIAFGHSEENCDKCHNGNISYGIEQYETLKHLPRAEYGNGINWVSAIQSGAIQPVNKLYNSLDKEALLSNEQMKRKMREKEILEKNMTIQPNWLFVPPAEISHAIHDKWLDCSNCHPAIFNEELNSTANLSMSKIINSEYCGVCHGKVSFPVDDCKSCHPGMKHSSTEGLNTDNKEH